MLPIRLIREQTDEVRRACALRGVEAPIDEILEADRARRALLAEVEGMRAERNQAGREIGATRDPDERQRLIDAQRQVAARLDELDGSVRERDEELQRLLLELPNLLHASVPEGGEEAGQVLFGGVGDGEPAHTPGRVTVSDAEAPAVEPGRRAHWEIGEERGLIDFERGTKIAGSRFYVLRGAAARLQRALISWMLDLHRERGWSEVYVPFVVREEMLVGSGQLPKFGDNLYRDHEDDVWLIPTAEVPVTNLYRDEILPLEALPIHHVAYTPCFRRERMSAGRDVRGIKRGHQFDKVELVKFCEPERSWDEHEMLLGIEEQIVQSLEIPYRVVNVAAGDLGASAAKKYDIEAWIPSQERYREITSCSNTTDFQSRRLRIRFRTDRGNRLVHTLNGTAVAVGRLLIAIMENHQQADGSVVMPDALRAYAGFDRIG